MDIQKTDSKFTQRKSLADVIKLMLKMSDEFFITCNYGTKHIMRLSLQHEGLSHLITHKGAATT
jgi:hypothetical protein